MSATLETLPSLLVEGSNRPPFAPPSFDVLGVPVSAVDLASAVNLIEEWADRRIRTYVCITGVHGVIECETDADLLDIHRKAGLVTPDGMPLVWVAHLKGLSHVSRVYGPDLMRKLSERAPLNKLRHYYFGAGAGVASKLSEMLRGATPQLDVVGTFSPPFGQPSPEEDQAIVEQINAAAPDILWVGLSTPKQEKWMAAHRDRLNVPIMIGVGAAFDFLSGQKKQAPRWMQRHGFEWLFRMASEPRRLSKRYLQIVPKFIFRLGSSMIR